MMNSERAGASLSRRALITGGGGGIGAAVADRLRADGAEVLTLDLQGEVDVHADVSDPSVVSRVAAEVGPIDIVVNNAGIVGPQGSFETVDLGEWDRTFAINVRGTFAMCQALCPPMVERGWGRVVNVASIAGKDGNPGMAAYSGSKAAVIALTKSLGKELARTGVLVNAVAPAVIDTPMNADTDPGVLTHITSLIPMRRLGRAEEVAELIGWLCSDAVSFSTGAVYDISGGRATY